MITLYLVRHGETVDNTMHIMQGQTQGVLTDKGIEQAHEVAEKMKSVAIDVFMSSDLKRAIDTCHIIAEPHRAKIITTSLLRERDWGSFTGRYIPDLKDETWPDDIEAIFALKVRAREFLNILYKNHKAKTVLAVGHGIINKAIQAVFYNKEMKDIPPMGNADIRTLNITHIY